MIFGDTKLQIETLVPPNRHQINEAILRFISSGGEIQKLKPAPANLGLNFNDGSGFHLEKIRVGLEMESE